MKLLMLILAFLTIPVSAELTLIGGDGAAKNRVRLIIVGDGYTAAQKSTFIADAKAMCDGIKKETYFSQFAGAMNVYAAFKESAESGADHPLQGSYKNTAFDGSFGTTASLERLVVCGSSKVAAFLKTELTNYDPNYDITLVLINDTQYGGSGGQIATTTKNPSGIPVAMHEIGHSFGRLTDEYDYQPEYSPKEAPNSTAQTTRNLIKWAAWIEAGTPIPTPEGSSYGTKVGLFEGACYRTTGWYRPWDNCSMKNLNSFCPVCTEEFVFVSYKQIKPIDNTVPARGTAVNGSSVPSISVTVLPLAQKPQITWQVNGTALPFTGETLNLASAGLKDGANTVKAIVKDNSGMVKIPAHFAVVSDTAVWTVNWSGGAAVKDSFALTVSAVNGTVTQTPSAAKYETGTSVSLKAVPNAGFTFTGWSGAVTGTANPITVLMNKEQSVTAQFTAEAVKTYLLTVNGGTGDGSYAEGKTVQITAEVPAGKEFVKWISADGVVFADAAKASTAITMLNKACTVTAEFKDASAPTYLLTVNGGTGSGSYVSGASVVITAEVPAGKQFVQWKSADGIVFADAKKASTAVTMLGKACAVTAEFKDAAVIDSSKLSVNLVEFGSWSISSDELGSKAVLDTSAQGKNILSGTFTVTAADEAKEIYPWCSLTASFDTAFDSSTLFKIAYNSNNPIRMVLVQGILGDSGVSFGYELPAGDTTLYLSKELFVQPDWTADSLKAVLDLKQVTDISFESVKTGADSRIEIRELKASNYTVKKEIVTLSLKARNTRPVELNGSQLTLSGQIQNPVVRILGFNGRTLSERALSGGSSLDIAQLGLSAGVYAVQVVGRNFQWPAIRCIIR